jgi:hypothetical protein
VPDIDVDNGWVVAADSCQVSGVCHESHFKNLKVPKTDLGPIFSEESSTAPVKKAVLVKTENKIIDL